VDCEKFDRIVLDLLYDELDELTSAAARRHMEHCTRCRGIGSGLRATREVGVLPLAEPPTGLEARLLEAERRLTRQLPLSKRLGRGLSLVAGYAMRPQLSMAALLMLMIGSSLFFLRAQPGDREHVLVTERGVPESDNDSVAVVSKKGSAPDSELSHAPSAPRAAARPTEALATRERAPEPKAATAPAEPAPAPPAAAFAQARGGGLANLDSNDKLGEEPAPGSVTDSDASYDAAMAAYRDGRYSEAERRFGELANQGGTHAPNAALYEAQALRMVSGCPSAAPRFEDVHTRYPGPVGNSAAWQAADCYRSLGEVSAARQTYLMLAADPSYKGRATEALAELDQQSSEQTAAARKAKPASSAPSKPVSAAAAAKPARPNAATPSP
jgi:TolA-binding protein